MRILGRLTLLSLFAATGVGLAVYVGTSIRPCVPTISQRREWDVRGQDGKRDHPKGDIRCQSKEDTAGVTYGWPFSA